MSTWVQADEDLFQHFFGASLDMLCIAGFDGYFKRINRAWCDTLGFTEEELLGRPYIDFVHPEDRNATAVEAHRNASGGSVLSFQNRYRCKDGSYRWLMWRSTPDAERQLVYALARDVTEQRRLEMELRVAILWQRAILDSANFTIISCRPDGIIETLNASALRELGYAEDELVGRVTPAVLHDAAEVEARARELSAELGREVAPGFETLIAKAKLGRPDEHEWTYVRKDGSRFPILLSVTALRGAGGEVVGFLGIGTNLTMRKRAEEELLRSNRDLEQFAYVASHDLKEPLRMVTNYLQLLERRYAGKLDADAHQFIDFAVDGAHRMRRLIDDLLEYSRVGTRGKPPVQTESAAVLRAVLENLSLAIEESGATVTQDRTLPTVLADETQLGQVFQNLIANALKFRGAEPPRIHIGAQRENGRWTFSVSDNGIGIAGEFFERIFVIFQRLHTREEYAGTGIGLAVCKKIVERHGGRIWVRSEPGAGTTFYFTLADAREAACGAEQGGRNIGGGEAEEAPHFARENPPA
jgi:PAS domain S-box-containing protein